LPIRKFGRPKEELDEGSKLLILEVHKKQNIVERRPGKIVEQEHGVHNTLQHRTFYLENSPNIGTSVLCLNIFSIKINYNIAVHISSLCRK
jgi:hypothetical protein